MRKYPFFTLALFNLVACTSGDDRGVAGDQVEDPGLPPVGASSGASTGTADAPAPTSAAPRIEVGRDSAALTSTDAKIHVRSENAPLLVVFRDGPTAPWQAATKLTANHYTATVHGPYQLGVVCEAMAEVAPPPWHLDTFVTWQVARTLDDPRDLVPPCVNQDPYNGLTGKATAASLVQIGEMSTIADATGKYITYSPLGSRDIIASTASKIAIARNVGIDYGYDSVIPAVDVAAQGKALTPVVLGIPNVRDGETVQAAVHVATATTDTSAVISLSPPATYGENSEAVNTAGINVASPATLTEPGDVQTVTASATLGSSVRSLARAFRLYGDTELTLPPVLAGGAFAYAAATQQVSAKWTALPEATALHLVLAGATTSPAAFSRQELHVSAAYLEAVNPTTAAVDLALPGYQAAWRIDMHQPYTRTLSAQLAHGDDVATSAVTETTHLP
ncbi:MAG TPA: hypothetical protein VGC42_20380 [Kofleriaceae bacterium]